MSKRTQDLLILWGARAALVVVAQTAFVLIGRYSLEMPWRQAIYEGAVLMPVRLLWVAFCVLAFFGGGCLLAVTIAAACGAHMTEKR